MEVIMGDRVREGGGLITVNDLLKISGGAEGTGEKRRRRRKKMK